LEAQPPKNQAHANKPNHRRTTTTVNHHHAEIWKPNHQRTKPTPASPTTEEPTTERAKREQRGNEKKREKVSDEMRGERENVRLKYQRWGPRENNFLINTKCTVAFQK
jgi:hypothetical protein